MKSPYAKVFAEIHAKLDLIEEHLIWRIRADERFRVGQRVQFSDRAIRKSGLVAKTRTKVKGTVQKVTEPFLIRVLFDDRRHPHTYHHAFFNPVRGPKVF